MTANRYFIVLAVACICSCSRQANISGQVFIVTGGRDNIKMGLVQVAAIPQEALLAHIQEKQPSRVEQKNRLRPQLEFSQKAANSASALLDWETLTIEYARPAERTKRLEKLAKAQVDNDAKLADLKKVKADLEHLDSPAFYFADLPTPTMVTKTDADGRFSLTMPPGKYVIAAESSRKIVGTTEKYFWLVSVDTAAAPQPFMLSNDNLVETKCRDCVALPP